LNRGAIEIIGDQVGERFARFVAPEDLHRVRMHFAKKLIGAATSTEFPVTVVTPGDRRVRFRVASVPLRERDAIVGVFGIASPGDRARGVDRDAKPGSAQKLTARQYQVLALLADGNGTHEIARRLGVAQETARNHIRGLLRQLEAHSRLEAVANAHKRGLLPRETV
jgi:DNA-binding CsgD family transcriptional regulator